MQKKQDPNASQGSLAPKVGMTPIDGSVQQVERGVAIITFANSSHAKKAGGVVVDVRDVHHTMGAV